MQYILGREQFDTLISALKDEGYRPLGPVVRQGSIIYGEVSSASDFPVGWTDQQDGGTYRLSRRDDAALFGYVVGQHSCRQSFHVAVARLWQAERKDGLLQIQPEETEPDKIALIGVRSCDLHAVAVQDRVFLEGPYVDSRYAARRKRAFLVAINCGHAGGTCFCVSMGTGPKATFGFDLVLTEVLQDSRHFFVLESGSDAGAAILQRLPCREASREEVDAAESVVANTARNMGRSMDTTDIHDLLMRNLEHPRWDNVAERCLTCTNCTLVCPTCFCTTVEDPTDLSGRRAERWQKWDSCFTMDFSFIHGGSVRTSTRGRYRQWMTHKLATWYDQFGTSGCVGCGRCITWCPVGIDITEEVAAIRESERAPASRESRHGNA